MPHLIVQTGPLKGNVYALDLERWRADELTLGRSKDCHILIHDAKVSKLHARLIVRDGRWYVEDLGSRNGIQLNGTRVSLETLSSGDELQVGNVVLLYREGEVEGGAASRSPSVATARRGGGAPGPDPTETVGPLPEPSAARVEEGERTPIAPTGAPPSPPPEARARTSPGPQIRLGLAPTRGEIREAVEAVRGVRDRVRAEVARVVIGQEASVDDLLVALFARGHCLIEGVPGLAKTLLVGTLASVLALEFKRIQFTPDLMPADITGTDVLDEDPVTRERRYRFIRGPVFANILLADEINRTPPKTQAALLEAMQEFHVTASGRTYALSPPFCVLATQNPIEQEGTYPLPEAQLDRFMFKLLIAYPSREDEVEILRATTVESDEEPEVVLGASDVLRLQKLVRRIPVSEWILGYAADLARLTRPGSAQAPDFIKKYLSWGAGPRAAQYLVLGAKARALLDGRVNITTADVRSVAPQVLRHRIALNFHAATDGVDADQIVARCLAKLPEPSVPVGGRS